MLLLMGAVEHSSHKVCWLRAAESGNDCVNWEVLDPAKSSVGRAGSVAWGRRPGRGCEEEWAPRSWKAEVVRKCSWPWVDMGMEAGCSF